MDRSAIKKELRQKLIQEEQVLTIINYIDNQILHHGRSSQSFFKNEGLVFLITVLIAFAAVAILSYYKTGGAYIIVPFGLPALAALNVARRRR